MVHCAQICKGLRPPPYYGCRGSTLNSHISLHLHPLLQTPEFTLNCQSAILAAQFHAFTPHLIVGGTYSGQVVLWDMRAKSLPVQATPMSADGHAHPVYRYAKTVCWWW